MSQSALLIWTLILLTTWHKSCLNSALSVTGNTPRSLRPQLTLMFCWGDIIGHTTHHGAELPGGWASGKCSQMDFKAVTQVLSLSRDWILVEHRLPCVPPRCEHVGVWRRRPCVIHVCKVTTSKGTRHCTSFLSFNFWILMLVWTQVFYRILWMYVNMQKCTSLHPGNRDYSDIIS